MRIWDISPGFLNDKSLLGEHRELHGIFSIVTTNKKGYAKHPETVRWKNFLSGLAMRHLLLVEEMKLRGFQHKSPLLSDNNTAVWPAVYIDPPARQFTILSQKYQTKPAGRIILPKNSQELWARHKYSVMARDYGACGRIGSLVAKKLISFELLAEELVNLLRSIPPEKSLKNTLLHMWGYISKYSEYSPKDLTSSELIKEIQYLSRVKETKYILHSTALGELAAWGVM